MYLEKPKGWNFQLVPAGNHVAVCWRVCDLGTQTTTWQGEAKSSRKVMLSWEIPDESVIVDGEAKPMIISSRYTFSMHEKAALRKDLESWRGRPFVDTDFGPTGFNIKNLLGKGCMLNVVHREKDGKTYANIFNVARLPKGLTTPAPVNPLVYFSMQTPADYSTVTFNSFPEWLQEIIRKSPEHHEIVDGSRGGGGHESENPGADLDDDIPF